MHPGTKPFREYVSPLIGYTSRSSSFDWWSNMCYLQSRSLADCNLFLVGLHPEDIWPSFTSRLGPAILGVFFGMLMHTTFVWSFIIKVLHNKGSNSLELWSGWCFSACKDPWSQGIWSTQGCSDWRHHRGPSQGHLWAVAQHSHQAHGCGVTCVCPFLCHSWRPDLQDLLRANLQI